MRTSGRRHRPDPIPDSEETDVTMLDAPSEQIEHGPKSSQERDVVASRIPALRPLSPVPTYVGIAVAAVGFVLIAVAWGQVAGEVNVALQVPYLVSGGLTGLALVMVGVTVVSVAARRRDAALREQQTALLADALRELSAALDPDNPR
jgi:hypothetical protein